MKTILAALARITCALHLLSAPITAFGGSATWNLNPTNSDWNTATNWTPATVPNGPNDTATFDVSNITDVFTNLGDDTEVNGIVFNAGASVFTITVASFISFDLILTISGVGISNNSGITQNFVTDAIGGVQDTGVIRFTNSSTAGDLNVFTNNNSGHTEFFDMSSAGSSTFKNNGGGTTFPGTPGRMDFFDSATADRAILIANGSEVAFSGGGTIAFQGDSTGGTARVEVFAGVATLNGNLDISGHNAPGVTVGSIEGDGDVFLGANNLTVGDNEHNTTFSGIIQDDGAGGSITKVGRKRLILDNANTYSGGTTVRGGSLFVRNRKGSGTGTGPVQVNGPGKLGGTGIIAGPVTIGTGLGSGALAELSPGNKGVQPGTLTMLNTLTFHSHGIYSYELNSDDIIADQVVANGVTIGSRAKFSLTDFAPGVLKNAELYDASAGVWSATDSLGQARNSHTATVLSDGNVLVAGGDTNSLGTSLNSAEIFDPALGTWSETGRLVTARNFHTATLLPDGKVLVTGGNVGFGPTASAELYDPASGVWTATGNMTSARYFHTATLLPSGQVLVVGSPSVATAELYDPASGAWTLTGRPVTSRWAHTATLLPNGKVLVAGGSTGIGNPTALAELYDPTTGTWTATGHLHEARQVHAATLLQDGRVLVEGGQGQPLGELTSAELYDSASGTWMTTGSLATPRAYHTATLLLDGKVIAAGGNNAIHFMEASVELYDPASGTWTATGSLDPGRFQHTASLLPSGKVLVAGGVGFGLPIGTVFTVIDNTSAIPINGTFDNLPDGSTIAVGGKSCQVSYSGGDGNDLTLTVVP